MSLVVHRMKPDQRACRPVRPGAPACRPFVGETDVIYISIQCASSSVGKAVSLARCRRDHSYAGCVAFDKAPGLSNIEGLQGPAPRDYKRRWVYYSVVPFDAVQGNLKRKEGRDRRKT